MDEGQATGQMSWPDSVEAEDLLKMLLAEKFPQRALASVADDVGVDLPGGFSRTVDLVHALVEATPNHRRPQLVRHLLGAVPGGPVPRRMPALDADVKRLASLCTVVPPTGGTTRADALAAPAESCATASSLSQQGLPAHAGKADSRPHAVLSQDAIAPEPIPASTEALARMLNSYHPIVWVGAGASQSAGYPGTSELLEELQNAADDPLPSDKAFTVVVDAFVKSMGRGALERVLERVLGPPRALTEFHLSLARLVKAGHVRTVVTTNYDDLLERAFAQIGAHVTLQVLDRNFRVFASPDTARLLKLHGDRADWQNVILSGTSYTEFSERYARLEAQLDLLREQQAILFVGYSMQDPRILGWLDRLGRPRREQLLPWRPMMLQSAWEELLGFSFDGRSALAAIAGAPIRPFIVTDHGAVPQLWKDAAEQILAASSPAKYAADAAASSSAAGGAGASATAPTSSPPAPTVAPPITKRAYGMSRAVWFGADRRLRHRDPFNPSRELEAEVSRNSGAFMRLVPSGWAGERPDASEVRRLLGSVGFLPLGEFQYGTSGLNADGFLIRETGVEQSDGVASIHTATQWFEDTGEVWGFDAFAVTAAEGYDVLAYVYLVKRWSLFLERSLATLRALGASGPILVEAGVVGLNGVRWAGRFQYERVLALKEAAFHEELLAEWSGSDQLNFLTRAFNEVRRAFGLPRVQMSELQQLL